LNEIYLRLLIRTLTRYELEEYSFVEPIRYFNANYKVKFIKLINRILTIFGIEIALVRRATILDRENGLDWPVNAETMIGVKRLNNLHMLLNKIRQENIKGDLMECGVWRGGAVIFMSAFLKTHEIDKKVFVADSFEGLPKPDSQFSEDHGDTFFKQDYLRVGLEVVKNNFEKYELMGPNIIFVKGYFEESLKDLNVQTLSLLRLDGDMYSSTWHSLTEMYPKVVEGGFVIIDDYYLKGAKAALKDYFTQYAIEREIINIDSRSVYFRK
jgi:O-methyltransferase